MMGYFPYSKEQQLGYQKKRPKKRRKRTIPSKRTRGKITKTEYQKAVEMHGYACYFCGSGTNLEMHHVIPKGYSRIKNGRGVWRNLRLLCASCHRGKDGVHSNPEKMKQLQDLHKELYGPYYYCDRFDLYKMGLIPDTKKSSYEKFMREEEQRAKTVYQRNQEERR